MSKTLLDSAAAAVDVSKLQAQLQDELQDKLRQARTPLVTEKIDHDGQCYIVKFRQHGQVRHLRSWLASLGCALLFGVWVRPARLRAGGLSHEAQRLRQLRAANLRVPQLVLQTADYLVLEFCGENLTQCLQQAAPDERLRLLERVFDELAQFHRAAQWHGGAQVRNLTLHHGQIYRIDFEEAAGHALPLPVIQAYDVLLTLQSIVDFLPHAADAETETETETAADADLTQGLALLQRYFEQTADAQVAQALARLARATDWLTRFASMLEKQAQQHRDVRRALRLAQLLRAYRLSRMAEG